MRQNGWKTVQLLILWTGTLLAIAALLYAPMDYDIANQQHGWQDYGLSTEDGEIEWNALAKGLCLIGGCTLAGMYLARGPRQK